MTNEGRNPNAKYYEYKTRFVRFEVFRAVTMKNGTTAGDPLR
jgi:hypothetical protein